MINKLKEFWMFLTEIFAKRQLIWELAKNDFKAKFAGSFFGVLWGFVLPIVTICVFWFVFTVMKSPPQDDFPFIVWFVPAYIPWMFFTDCLSNTVGSLYEYSYLVKKVKFRTSMLPLVKIISIMMVNLFFVGVIFIIMAVFKIPITLYVLQIIYYYAALVIFCVGISWFVSSVAVFFKDMSPLVNVVVQLGFWVTPIFWSLGGSGMPSWIVTIAKLNPIYYITQGFRESFLYGIGFWQSPVQTLYFWVFTAIVFVGGAMVFRRLRPHFADVL
ncbi:MAG: ABC transporter permease [Christensenella sp.]